MIRIEQRFGISIEYLFWGRADVTTKSTPRLSNIRRNHLNIVLMGQIINQSIQRIA